MQANSASVRLALGSLVNNGALSLLRRWPFQAEGYIGHLKIAAAIWWAIAAGIPSAFAVRTFERGPWSDPKIIFPLSSLPVFGLLSGHSAAFILLGFWIVGIRVKSVLLRSA